MTPALTLALDAATAEASVALVRGAEVLAERVVAMRDPQSERLMPAVAGVLKDAGIEPAAIQQVVCGSGPGSFTGLRIAASIAKGIATGRGVPLLAVSSLSLMVAGSGAARAPGRYVAVLDALRGEVFAAVYEVSGSGAAGIREMQPVARLSDGEVGEVARRYAARGLGPAAAPGVSPRASGFAAIGEGGGLVEVVDVVSWEPVYGRLAEAQVRWEAAHGRPLPP
jgi:tRNA threonylcarbamoyladenosine biosynthesis protein TsaB